MTNLSLVFAAISVLIPFISGKFTCDSPKPDFKAVGRRISEQKCLEYNYERNMKEKCTSGSSNTEYPYMGMMGFKVKEEHKASLDRAGLKVTDKDGWVFICAAFLISPKFALTDSECIKGEKSHEFAWSGPYIVRFGSNELRGNVPYVNAKVLRTITFTPYKPNTSAIEPGLVELETPLTFTKSILPACLWSSPSLQGIYSGIVPGWATNSLTAESDNIMNAREIRVHGDVKTCEQTVKRLKGDMEKIICTNGTAIVLDRGSAGIPLVSLAKVDGDDRMPYALGVHSGIFENSNMKMFVRINSFIDWIEQNVWPNAV